MISKRYSEFNDIKVININKWSIKCSLISIIVSVLLYIIPYLMYKIGLINDATFYLFILVIVIFSCLGIIIYCNFQNGLFITNNVIN